MASARRATRSASIGPRRSPPAQAAPRTAKTSGCQSLHRAIAAASIEPASATIFPESRTRSTRGFHVQSSRAPLVLLHVSNRTARHSCISVTAAMIASGCGARAASQSRYTTATQSGNGVTRPRKSSRRRRQIFSQSAGASASPSLQNSMPDHATAEMCGCLDTDHSFSSPSATLTGIERGTADRTACHTEMSERPSDPCEGSFTSMIDAPPATAARASKGDRTLTSRLANSGAHLELKGSLGHDEYSIRPRFVVQHEPLPDQFRT